MFKLVFGKNLSMVPLTTNLLPKGDKHHHGMSQLSCMLILSKGHLLRSAM